jgi:hypothetical protein
MRDATDRAQPTTDVTSICANVLRVFGIYNLSVGTFSLFSSERP